MGFRALQALGFVNVVERYPQDFFSRAEAKVESLQAREAPVDNDALSASSGNSLICERYRILLSILFWIY